MDRTAPEDAAGRIEVVIGNPHAGGRTTRVALAVATRLRRLRPALSIEVTELADSAPSVLDHDDPALTERVARVAAADALVVASPTYKASFTGLLKAFLDRFAAGSLVGVTTVPVMLGGSDRHALAVETQLRPVLIELGATMPTAGIYVVDSELDGLDPSLDEWLDVHHSVLAATLAADTDRDRSGPT